MEFCHICGKKLEPMEFIVVQVDKERLPERLFHFECFHENTPIFNNNDQFKYDDYDLKYQHHE